MAAEIRHDSALRVTAPRLAKIDADVVIGEHAEQILARVADQACGFADAVSVAVVRERGIDEALAFDGHCSSTGFTLMPDRGYRRASHRFSVRWSRRQLFAGA